MFDFPSTPAIGATYSSGGVSYTWDGQAWVGGPVTLDSVAAGKLADLKARTNLLFNGDFAISQRAGYAVVAVGGLTFADGWWLSLSPANGNAQVVGRATSSGPLQRGRFRAIGKCTTVKASLAAGDIYAFIHPLEGNETLILGWGLASGMPAVLRFGFKGPAGTYGVSVCNAPSDKVWAASFTISAAQANVDTIQTFAIPAPPATGQWVVDNTRSMVLRIAAASGSTCIGAMGWGTANVVMPAGGFNFFSSLSNQVELFDVNFVPDPDGLAVDPGFAPEDQTTTLARCQRYYVSPLLFNIGGYVGAAGAVIYDPVFFPVPMRVTPASVLLGAGTAVNVTATALSPQNNQGGCVQVTATAAGQVTAANYAYALDAQL